MNEGWRWKTSKEKWPRKKYLEDQLQNNDESMKEGWKLKTKDEKTEEMREEKIEEMKEYKPKEMKKNRKLPLDFQS